MNKLLTAAALILMVMGGIAAADIQEDWQFGERNVAPAGIEYAYWDFEEGSNCEIPFKNQHPDVATFLNVDSSRVPVGYGPDQPSYVRIGGRMCGTTRCYMRIYPHPNLYNNGTPMPWIYIVNGRAAFAPVTCCESSECRLGECCPGMNAKIEFKEDTTYISFLVSTGNKVYIRLYDRRGNWLGSETVYRTIDRVGSEPSNFTRFSIYMPDKEIRSMTVSGTFNDWHIDDMIIGGEAGYLNKPVDYAYVARLAQELHGVWYLEHGLGYDYEDFTYAEPFQFNEYLEYWNPETKTFEHDQGISNPGLILWAYNKDSEYLAGTSFVKHITPAKMMKHDFKVEVDSADTQPGDVYFMDYTHDGVADFVGMVIEMTPTEMDLIASEPPLANDPIGVIYSTKAIAESSPAFMGYHRLPGTIRGGHKPIPKGH